MKIKLKSWRTVLRHKKLDTWNYKCYPKGRFFGLTKDMWLEMCACESLNVIDFSASSFVVEFEKFHFYIPIELCWIIEP